MTAVHVRRHALASAAAERRPHVTLRGVRMELHPVGEGVSDGIRRSGDFYEAAILDYLAANHPAHGVIVDAGANIGNHALFFAEFLKHDAIWAFEPLRANFDVLARNVWPYPSIQAYPIALSDRATTIRMAPNPANMGASKVTADGSETVPAQPLDLAQLTDVTLLKIDVENHEPEVLRGAAATIARSHPLILIEDWTFGGYADLLPGYDLERAWTEAFTYLYRWAA